MAISPMTSRPVFRNGCRLLPRRLVPRAPAHPKVYCAAWLGSQVLPSWQKSEEPRTGIATVLPFKGRVHRRRVRIPGNASESDRVAIL